MASDFERDKSVDRLLSGARRGSPAETSEVCLDAETLAAWSDGGLAPGQVRLVEAHLAGCARCRAIVQTIPEQAATAAGSKVVPFKRSKVMYWLPIAAGTVAATLVIWLGVENNQQPQPAQVLTESLPAAAPPPVAAQQPSPAEPKTGPAGAAAPQASSVETQLRVAQESSPRTKKEVARADAVRAEEVRAEPAAAPKPQAGGVVGGTVGKPTIQPPVSGASLPGPLPVNAPPPPPPPPVSVATPTPSPLVLLGQQGQAGALASNAAARDVAFRANVAIVAEFSSADPRTAPPAPLNRVGNVAAGGGGRGGGRGGGGAGAGGGRVVADQVAISPDVHWRIFERGALGKSTDRVTWEMITIDPPVAALTAGAAPSPQVCWLVGPNGLVLRSTDARQFSRVTSPTSANLTRVDAVDALRATVTTADGQKYTTTDGGKSWSQ